VDRILLKEFVVDVVRQNTKIKKK